MPGDAVARVADRGDSARSKHAEKVVWKEGLFTELAAEGSGDGLIELAHLVDLEQRTERKSIERNGVAGGRDACGEDAGVVDEVVANRAELLVGELEEA